MKKKTLIRIAAIVLFVIINIALIYALNKDRPRFIATKNTGTEYETARVLEIIEDNSVIDETTENVRKGSQDIKVEILTGRYKGNVSFITNYFSALYNVDVKAGDTVCVRIDTLGEMDYSVSVYNYNRFPLVIGLLIVFFAFLAICGGKKGIKAFAGLVYTFICICYILLPLVLNGANAVVVTSLIVFVTTTFCFVLLNGFSGKTLSAELGCMCGVLIAALLGVVSSKIGGVTTFQTDEAEALLLVRSTFGLKMRGLFASGILIASMGAVMDVAMSIASSVNELAEVNKKMTVKELFKSGMNIGRDAMGTMANTLVLAYVGSSLNMMVLIYSYGVSFRQLINTDFAAIELINAISGSVGIVFTVPCVSIISAFLCGKRTNKKV